MNLASHRKLWVSGKIALISEIVKFISLLFKIIWEALYHAAKLESINDHKGVIIVQKAEIE